MDAIADDTRLPADIDSQPLVQAYPGAAAGTRSTANTKDRTADWSVANRHDRLVLKLPTAHRHATGAASPAPRHRRRPLCNV